MGDADARLAETQAAFALFDDPRAAYVGDFLASIYANDATNFNGYREFSGKTAITHASGGDQPFEYRAADFLTLLNDRAPQRRNEALLATDGVWAQIHTIAHRNPTKRVFDGVSVGTADQETIFDVAKAPRGSDTSGGKPHTKLVAPVSRLRVFLEALIKLNDAGALQAAPADATSKFSSLFLSHVADILKGGAATADEKHGYFLDGRTLFGSSDTTPGRLDAIMYYLNANLNPVVKSMTQAIVKNDASGLKNPGGDRPGLIAQVVLNNTTTANTAVAFDNVGNAEAALRGATMSLRDATYTAADAAVYSGVAFQRMLGSVLFHAFRRGPEGGLKDLYWNCVANGGSPARITALNTYIAAQLSSPLQVIAGNNYPAGYVALVEATAGRNHDNSAALFAAADVNYADFGATLGRMERKLTTHLTATLAAADVKKKVEEAIENTPDLLAPNAVADALKTWSSGVGKADFVPGLNVMHELLRAIDTTLWGVYEKAGPEGQQARLDLAPLYWQENKKHLPPYALATYSWQFQGRDALPAGDLGFATESLTSPDALSAKLTAWAHEIYDTSPGAAVGAVGARANVAATHNPVRAVPTYLFGCAMATSDFARKSHMLFGPIEETWFHDRAGAKTGDLFGYDHAGGGGLGDNDLGAQQATWLAALSQKLNARYGFDLRIPAAFPAFSAAAAGLNTRADIFASIKRYAKVLVAPQANPENLNMLVDDVNALTFAQLRTEVAAFREIQRSYQALIAMMGAAGKTDWQSKRAQFASAVVTRGFELLYAGVKPTQIFDAVKDARELLPGNPTPDRTKIEAMVTALNGLRTAIPAGPAGNPFVATIVDALGFAAAPNTIVVPSAEQMTNTGVAVGGGGGGGGGGAPSAPASSAASSTSTASTRVFTSVSYIKPEALAAAVVASNSTAIAESVSPRDVATEAVRLEKQVAVYTSRKQAAPAEVQVAAGSLAFANAKNVTFAATGYNPAKMPLVVRKVWNALAPREKASMRRIEASLAAKNLTVAQRSKLRSEKSQILNNAFRRTYSKQIAAVRARGGRTAAPASPRAQAPKAPQSASSWPDPGG